MSFVLGLAASIMVCFFDQGTSEIVLYSVVLLLAKAGAELAFGFVTLIHLELFPTSFIVTSYGICNIVCRMVTMFAPIVAEIPNQGVILTFMVGANSIGLIATLMLKTRTIEIVDPK